MKFRNGIIALGFLVFIMQFLGFPQAWKNGGYAVIGLGLMALAYVGGRKKLEKPAVSQTAEPSAN